MATSGRNVIATRITFEGGTELEAQLKRLGAAGEEAFNRIQAAADKVKGPSAEFQAKIKSFGDGIKAAGDRMVSFGETVTKVGAGISIIGAAVGGAVAGIVALAKSGGDAADQMQRQAASAGLTIDQYAKLQFAAEQAEVSADQFTEAMGRLSRNLVLAQEGNKVAAKAFSDLKVKITQGNGALRPTIDIVTDLSDAFAKMPDGAKKSAAAIALFGRGGIALIPFLNTSKKGLQELFDQVDRLGLGFSKSEAEIGDKLSDTLNLLKRSISALKDHIGLAFAPLIIEAAQAIIDFIAKVRGPIISFVDTVTQGFDALPGPVKALIGILVGTVVVLGPIILALGAFVAAIGFAVGGIGSLISGFSGLIASVAGFGGILEGIGTAIGAIIVFMGSWAFAIAALVIALVALAFEVVQHWDQITAAFNNAYGIVISGLSAFGTFLLGIWNSILSGISGAVGSIVSPIVAVFSSLGERINAGWNIILDAVKGLVSSAKDLFSGMVTEIGTMFQSMASTAKGFLDDIVTWLEGVITKAAIAARAITNAAHLTNDNQTAGARWGGFVSGPGSGTSDSIPARLSSGEFVIRSAAVRKYGLALFSALNGMSLKADGIKMSLGGLVSDFNQPLRMAPMRFAEGGMVGAVSSGRPFTLVLDGKEFVNLRAPQDTAEDLIKFARARQVRSAGRKPSWFAGGSK